MGCSLYILLLVFQFCSLWASASIVTCQTSKPSAGQCDRTSNGCSPDSLCTGNRVPGSYSEDVRNNIDLEKCLSGRLERYCPADYSTPTSVRLANVSVDIIPFDGDEFAVNVSWALASAGDQGGIEVRLQRIVPGTTERVHIRCLCINSQQYRNFKFRFLRYKYTEDIDMTVTVRPFPAPGVLAKEVHFRRPRTCDHIPPPACDMNHYGQVHNISVVSSVCNDTKQLAIGWAPLPSFPTPPVYYVYIYPLGSSTPEYIFTVRNATGVVVGNLSARTDYTVQLELYGRCSAVNLPSGYRGCGSRSANTVEVLASVCDVSTTADVITTADVSTTADVITTADVSTTANSTSAVTTVLVQPFEPLESNSEPSKPPSPLLLLVLIPSFIVVVVVVALLVALVIWRWHPSSDQSRPECVRDTYQHPQVFVFYSPSTPQGEVTDIQKHIVCPLLQYFEVVTPNDFHSGNLPVWMERTVEMSKSVLLVSNKEFCMQWASEKGDGDPAVNSLRLIITAAVAQNDVDKFGIVTDPTHSRVPFNSYLENLPVFVFSKNRSKNELEVEKIYHFVTRVPTFQFGTGTTPTIDGPANVAVQAV